MSVVAISSMTVMIPLNWFIALAVVLIAFMLFLGGLILAYIERKEEDLQLERKKIRQEEKSAARREIFQETDTLVVPMWRRDSSPLDDISPTLEHRLMRRNDGNDHYPFLLPDFDPMTPLPDVMKVPPRIAKVVMRANDFVQCTDQYGFVMPEFSGLWQNVELKIIDNYNGDWMVPKEKTGYHKITRFKRVRPQDHRIPPILHPRDLPEVPAPVAWPHEMSPTE